MTSGELISAIAFTRTTRLKLFLQHINHVIQIIFKIFKNIDCQDNNINNTQIVVIDRSRGFDHCTNISLIHHETGR